MFARFTNLTRSSVRSFATKPTTFREKTLKEVWCGDSGAYPVMGVIAFAVLFSSSASAYLFFNTPDSRVTKAQRKSIFRGELEGTL